MSVGVEVEVLGLYLLHLVLPNRNCILKLTLSLICDYTYCKILLRFIYVEMQVEKSMVHQHCDTGLCKSYTEL